MDTTQRTNFISSGGHKCKMGMRAQKMLILILPNMKQSGDIKYGDKYIVVW